MLQEHHEGIIATSACLGGPVANPFLDGNEAKARDYAGKLAEISAPSASTLKSRIMDRKNSAKSIAS